MIWSVVVCVSPCARRLTSNARASSGSACAYLPSYVYRFPRVAHHLQRVKMLVAQHTAPQFERTLQLHDRASG